MPCAHCGTIESEWYEDGRFVPNKFIAQARQCPGCLARANARSAASDRHKGPDKAEVMQSMHFDLIPADKLEEYSKLPPRGHIGPFTPAHSRSDEPDVHL